MPKQKVIIIGGGFGGLNAAQSLKRADVDVLVIDRTNHHLFQPLLYQVATAALAPGNIATPIREVLRKQKNASVIMAEIVDIDTAARKVKALDGTEFPYDYLIVAPGARHSYFGHDEWEKFAPGLKTLQDANRIRDKVLLAFERAERCDNPEEVSRYLRFVVIGGGPTGVEMAGAIAEIAYKTMFDNFRKINPAMSEIYIIEGDNQVLPSYSKELGGKAKDALEKMGVKVLLNSKVTAVNEDGVMIGDRLIETSNSIWAAGNQASPLLQKLNVPLDKNGRVKVNPDLTIPGCSEVFVIGDAALAFDKEGKPLPGIAPTAIQQGKYVAKLIKNKAPSDKRKPFQYFDKGNMATIGRAKAVAQIGKIEISGFIAWLAWCFIHILYLISFKNKLLVMLQWMYLYISGARTERLIMTPIFLKKAYSDWYNTFVNSLYAKHEVKTPPKPLSERDIKDIRK